MPAENIIREGDVNAVTHGRVTLSDVIGTLNLIEEGFCLEGYTVQHPHDFLASRLTQLQVEGPGPQALRPAPHPAASSDSPQGTLYTERLRRMVQELMARPEAVTSS